jgi:hypothetical protein
MTDTTTVDETSDETLPELVESEHLGAGGTAEDTPLKTRLILPFLVPLLSIAIVAVLVLNISRVFLAGDHDAALIMGIVITLGILVGASLVAAAPRLRTTSLALILGGVFVVVSGAGLVSLGPSLDEGEGGGGGWQEPAGPAVATFSAVAYSSPLSFNREQNGSFSAAPAGIIEIELSGDDGHTFAFREPEFAGFLLGPTPNPPLKGKVELESGEYEFYCTIPGHAAAGMQGTLTVSQ